MPTITTLIQDSKYPKKVILEKLVCHVLDIEKRALFLDSDREINNKQAARIDNAYKAYTIEKQPLEYILGRVEFLQYRFNVTPATLIPRPETEYMIEAINDYIKQEKQTTSYDKKKEGTEGLERDIILLDIGTGCGVLGLSVIIHNPGVITHTYLSDLSTDALAVAKENAVIYTDKIKKENITFLEASLLDHTLLQDQLLQDQDIILVANLPYIPEQLFEDNTDERVKKREPKMAFVGGDDGLDLYRIMFDQLIVTKNKTTTMFLEMMTRQVDILRQAYKKDFLFEEVKTFHFNIRIVKATLL